MTHYQIRPLLSTELRQMHRSFLEAFSDYPIPMALDFERFRNRMLHKLNIRFDLSLGAFSGQKLVGFVFHTVNDYMGAPVVYNGGTGVIPGHRGQGLVVQMYDYFKQMPDKAAHACLLEVISTNNWAMAAYERAGFTRGVRYKCYQQVRNIPDPGELPAGALVVEAPPGTWPEPGPADLRELKEMDTYETSFTDTFEQLRFNRAHETLLKCFVNGKLAGYLIFQPETGRITRIAVSYSLRRQGLGTLLMRRAFATGRRKKLTVINVREGADDVIGFLKNIGFDNQVDQWEMKLQI